MLAFINIMIESLELSLCTCSISMIHLKFYFLQRHFLNVTDLPLKQQEDFDQLFFWCLSCCTCHLSYREKLTGWQEPLYWLPGPKAPKTGQTLALNWDETYVYLWGTSFTQKLCINYFWGISPLNNNLTEEHLLWEWVMSTRKNEVF